MKSCSEYEALLSAYLDGELSSGKQEEVCHHLEGCSSCQLALKRLQEVVSWTSSLPSVSPPSDLKERILRHTVYYEGRGYIGRSITWGKRIGIPAVGTAILLGFFWWYSFQGMKSPVADEGRRGSPSQTQGKKVNPPGETFVTPQIPTRIPISEVEKGSQGSQSKQVTRLASGPSIQQVAGKMLVLSKEGSQNLRSVLQEARKPKELGDEHSRDRKGLLGGRNGLVSKPGKNAQEQDSHLKEGLPVDEIKGSTPPSLPPMTEPSSEPLETKKDPEGMLASVGDHPPEVAPSSANPSTLPLWRGTTSEEQNQEILRRLQKRWSSSEERILKVDILRIRVDF